MLKGLDMGRPATWKWLKPLMYCCMLVAALGFSLSIAAHIASICGKAIPSAFPVMDLHIGIFVVWFPAVLVVGKMTGSANRKDLWKIALSGCPLWMRRTVYVLFGYTALNFVLFMMRTGTDRDAGDASPSIVWGFSGHWLLFYGVAFAIFYSAVHAPSLLEKRFCSHEHLASPLDQYCPKCGQAIPR